MPVSYRVFKHWREVERMPDRKDFIFYETSNGSIIALSYSGMLSLFMQNSKHDIVKKNAMLICGLDNALSCGKTQGQIDI